MNIYIEIEHVPILFGDAIQSGNSFSQIKKRELLDKV